MLPQVDPTYPKPGREFWEVIISRTLSLFKSSGVNHMTGDAFQVVFSKSGEFILWYLRLNLTVDILKDIFYRSDTDHSDLGGLDALIQQRF